MIPVAFEHSSDSSKFRKSTFLNKTTSQKFSIKNTLYHNWLLTLATFTVLFVLIQPLFNQLIWDDVHLISANPAIGDPAYWDQILTQSFWQNSNFTQFDMPGFWRPITSLTLWVVGFFSKSSICFHLLSVLLALGCGLGIAMLTSSYHKTNREKSRHQTIVVIASLYLLHPLTAEVFCLVSNISDHLCMSFFILSMFLANKFIQHNQKISTLIIFFLTVFFSIGSKEFGIICLVIPFILPLTERRPGFMSVLKNKEYRKLLIADASAVTLYMLGRYLIFSTSEQTQIFEFHNFHPQSVLIGSSFALKQIFVPRPIGAEVIVSNTFLYIMMTFILAVLFIVLFFWQLKKMKSQRNIFALLLSLFILNLSFTTIFPDELGRIALPTRYFHVVIPALLFNLFIPISNLLQKRVGKLMLFTLILLLAALSFIRIQHWRDAVALFSEEVRCTPESEKATILYAQSLLDVKAFTDAEKAIRTFEQSYKFNSVLYSSYRDSILSQVYFYRDGDFMRAYTVAKQALVKSPYTPLFVVRLSEILYASGHIETCNELLLNAIKNHHFSIKQKEYLKNAFILIQPTKQTNSP